MGPSAAPADPAGRINERHAWSFGHVLSRERREAEAFIRNGLGRAYGARLSRLMPELVALRRGAMIAAACGLRRAGAEKLFLEIYLDAPVETILQAAADPSVTRADITEVGNLVISRPGYARRLIVHLAAHLYTRGSRWVVFTAVPALRNGFSRIGIPMVALGAADAGRLSAEERTRWGSYYDHSPMVTAVNVSDAFHAVCEAACTR